MGGRGRHPPVSDGRDVVAPVTTEQRTPEGGQPPPEGGQPAPSASIEPTGAGRRRRLGRWALWGAGAVALVIAGLAAAGALYLGAALPGVGDAEERVQAILDAHGGTPGPMPPPARLGQAVVDVEDENFYSNVAVDILDGAGRAALALAQRGGDPGGSTIGQQLAKTLYPHGGGVGGTLEEIGLAVKLSLHYSKDRLLNMYLNSVYYGHGYWGDVAAARGYFGLSPRRLSWGQASLLAGLPQAPSALDPELHPGLARRRQRHVLDQLVDNGDLSKAEAGRALRQPWGLQSPATSRRRKTTVATASAGSE